MMLVKLDVTFIPNKTLNSKIFFFLLISILKLIERD